MSTDATASSAQSSAGSANTNSHPTAPTAADKGKGKHVNEDAMDEDDEDDEEDEDEEEEDEDEEMDEDDDLAEVDPSVILGRRTRGARVDYTSAAALEKAGLKPESAQEDEDAEDSFVADQHEK